MLHLNTSIPPPAYTPPTHSSQSNKSVRGMNSGKADIKNRKVTGFVRSGMSSNKIMPDDSSDLPMFEHGCSSMPELGDTDTPIDVQGLPLVSMADVLPLQTLLIAGIEAKGGPKEQFDATEDEFAQKRLGRAILGQLKSRVFERFDTMFENIDRSLKDKADRS